MGNNEGHLISSISSISTNNQGNALQREPMEDVTKIGKGDLIRVIDNEALVQSQQERYNVLMKSCLGKIGYVRFITAQNMVRTKHGPNSWTWNSICVQRLSQGEIVQMKALHAGTQTFGINDFVEISSDAPRVKQLQVLSGIWRDSMNETFGKYAYVKRVFADAVLVKVHGATLAYHPACLSLIVPASESSALIQGDINSLLQQIDTSNQWLKPLLTNDLEQLKMLHKQKAFDINETSNGATLVQMASGFGKKEIVDWCIQEGCDLALPDADGDLPIHDASARNHAEIVNTLILAGSPVNAGNKCMATPLHLAVLGGHMAVIQCLIQHQADIALQDKNEDTPLHLAIALKKTDIANFLLDSGAPLQIYNKRNTKVFNILQWIAFHNTFDIFQHVSETKSVGELANASGEDGFTPLHLIAINNHKECCRLFCQLPQIRLNSQNNLGQTPLHLAVVQKSHGVMDMLLNHGDVDIHLGDNSGDTVLHDAVRLGSKSPGDHLQVEMLRRLIGLQPLPQEKFEPEVYRGMARQLVLRGANPMQTNNAGKTPIDLCKDSDLLIFLRLHSPKADTLTKKAENFKATVTSDKAEQPMAGSSSAIKRMQEAIIKAKMQSMCLCCQERPFKVIFQCGHSACDECASMENCSICHSVISNRMRVHSSD